MKRRKRLSLEEYKSGILSGDRVGLSRAITLVESTLDSDNELAAQLIDEIYEHTGNSFRVGITGVPGVGKSTFIESFGKHVIDSGKKLAVLTIDPSSQKTGGSILGDKTRMETLSRSSNAFIRPSPSGDALGGVAHKTRETMLLCEAAGYDFIIIETVGVGQSETAVKNMVDFFLLLMLAGAGDELQGIKKGIMEMADAIAINKADGENVEPAKKAKKEYQNALHLFPANENGWNPKVKTCSAIKDDGLSEILELLEQFHKEQNETGFFDENRKDQAIHWMHQTIHHFLKRNFYKSPEILEKLSKFEAEVRNGTKHSVQAARTLLNQYYN
ncbi:methylmalonyl Co-A mutase-associated GTPase MeaB [Marivirga arenosa]|uniref:Methylmalonyl Co-A mutase-associated GTPase MeaB n=1 Tax=Marivirga arenosa TaxID=3059076 RepID=A0AA51N6S7_9BACT|nr:MULTISPECIES: methylmalonyl Co-A mutase-associated GTPase MeaB [unclassified Marivirga]WMN07224.1 methylmalonyl Co-A mutase-associated GTPase MeaB [Marivirga sp. ABR2-2]WNB18571.1 methylmalonyl Co-A mutase-associated GTPase MeaB [Marivirga sp. BKB1-2]